MWKKYEIDADAIHARAPSQSAKPKDHQTQCLPRDDPIESLLEPRNSVLWADSVGSSDAP